MSKGFYQSRGITKYSFRGGIVSRSRHHMDMWIIDHNNGKFTCLHTSEEVMVGMYKPDGILLR